MTPQEMIEKIEREGIELATINRRSWAYFVDEMIVSLLFIGAYFGLFSSMDSPESIIAAINGLFIEMIILKVIYHAFFVWMYGATPGKMLLKIRVVSLDDIEKPLFGVALLRAGVRIVSEMLLYIGFIWGMLDPSRQTWHDKVAKTLVVDV